MTPSPKIEPRHQRLQAIVYIRQSTPKQVQNNQESTRRQYQLAERARQMGWAASQIRVIDEDLGLSGASSRRRTGFQSLVAAIGLGEVGIILVTEVSRLSRCNSDWHRVIELCGVFRTLIADEDGVYDPPSRYRYSADRCAARSGHDHRSSPSPLWTSVRPDPGNRPDHRTSPRPCRL